MPVVEDAMQAEDLDEDQLMERARENLDAASKEGAEKTSGSEARRVPQPAAKHVLAGHIPHANWCRLCTSGRAKDDHRRRQEPRESTRSVAQADYMFLTRGA